MSWQETWERLTSHPDWNSLPEGERNRIAGKFGRKFVAPAEGDTVFKNFLNENISKREPAKSGSFTESAKVGFNENLAGLGAQALTGKKVFNVQDTDVIQPGILSVAKDALGRTFGQLADPVGGAIDLVTGGIGGKVAGRVATPLARKAIIAGAGAASGAIQGGASAALQGQVNGKVEPMTVGQSALLGALLGGGTGAMFAGKAPKTNAAVEAAVQSAPVPQKPLALPMTKMEADLRAQGFSPKQVAKAVEMKARQANQTQGPVINANPVPPKPKLLPETTPINVPPGGFNSTPKAITTGTNSSQTIAALESKLSKVNEVIDSKKTVPPHLKHLQKELTKQIEALKSSSPVEPDEALRGLQTNPTGAAEEAAGKVFIDGAEHPTTDLRTYYDRHISGKAKGDIVVNPRFVIGKVSTKAMDEAARIIPALRGMDSTLRLTGRSFKHIDESHNNHIDSIIEHLTTHPVDPDEVLPNPSNANRVLFVYGKEPDSHMLNVVEAERSGDGLYVVSVFPVLEKRLNKARAMKSKLEGRLDLPHHFDAEAPHADTDFPDVQSASSLKDNIPPNPIKLDNQGGFVSPDLHKLPGMAVSKADELVDKVSRRLTSAATEGVAKAVNKVAGKEVLKGGLDPVTKEDRLGNQLAEGYDWLRREAGRGNPALDSIRRNVLNDYDLPAEYIARKDKQLADARKIRQEGEGYAATIREKGNSDKSVEERLYNILNDRKQTNTDLSNISEPVRNRIDALSDELESLGQLPTGVRDEKRGQYLKRLYDTYLNQAPIISRWHKMANNAIKGSQHRGKKEVLSEKAWSEVQQPWKVVGEAGDSVVISNGKTQRTVPTSVAGDFVANWKVLGKQKNGKVVAWRDWTPDERTSFGEHKVASDAIEATFKDMAKNVANGRFLKDIANTPEWSQKKADGIVPPDGWVYFGDEEVKQMGGKKWGALAGHYVEPNIARDLIEMEKAANTWKEWKFLLGEWKKNVTSRNIKSHVNNFAQNSMTLELNGGSLRDLPEAINVVRDKGELFRKLEEAGLFDNTFVLQELANNTPTIRSGSIKDVMSSMINGLGKLDQKVTDIYQGADDLFRAALVIGKMRDGIPMDEAVKLARTRMYNAKLNAPAGRMVRDLGVLPFVSATYWSAAEVPKMILRNPGKAVKLAAYWYLFNKMSEGLTGLSDDDVKGREAMLDDYQKGPGFVASSPVRDTKGQQLIINTANWSPLSFADTSDRTAIPGWPSSLVPSGPLGTLYGLAANYDARTQKPIRNDAKPALNQAGDVARYAADMLGPSTPIKDVARVVDAAMGKADPSGRRYDVPTAIANLAGIKAQPFDPQQGMDKLRRKYKAKLRDADDVLSEAKKKFNRGNISSEDLAKTRREQNEIKSKLRAQFKTELEQARKAVK